MLVGYSSSSSGSDEESEAGALTDNSKRRHDVDHDGSSVSKKLKAEEPASETRLPVPRCLLDMFPEEGDPQTDGSSLHGGRLRSFKHERGNWATCVYFPYHPHEEFSELLEELLEAVAARDVVLTPQTEFHLSLSQTVVLRHHWIQPFTQSLRARLVHCRRFVCSAGKLRVYCNAEKTRTFLGMEVSTGQAQLLEVVKAVDQTMAEFRLETFYKDPSFHVSLAWCVGDFSKQLKDSLQELQSLADDHEEGPFLLRVDCRELRCKAGNKTFGLPLGP